MLRRTFLSLFCVLCLTPWAGVLPAGASDAPRIIVLGDSISAGYGLETGAGWVDLLQQRLAAAGLPHEVVNASINGETTAGGRYRLPKLLEQHRPAVVVLELGGNDGLRGLPVGSMRDNLEAMIRHSREAGARVLLLGMRLPPNYGAEYTDAFHAAFGETAQRTGIALVPFLLAGLEGQLEYMQADGIHPGAEMQTGILENVWQQLEPILTADRPGRSTQAAQSGR